MDGNSGVISTAAGTGVEGYSGDGGAATDAQVAGPAGVALDSMGNLFIADAFNQRVGNRGSICAAAMSRDDSNAIR